MSTNPSLTHQAAADQNWRQRKIKVTTKETPELHAFRARYAYLVRRLPKRLQATMFAHIIMTDCRTRERRYAKTLMAAYSAVIAPNYKLPVASVASIKRYNLELIALGYITREIFHDSAWDSRGNLRHRQMNSYTVQTMALDMFEIDQGEPITAPTTAPYVVPKGTASRKTESRINAASSSSEPDGSPDGPDDEEGTFLPPPGEPGSDVASEADEAVSLVLEITGSFIPVNPEVLRRKMEDIAASQDVSMIYLAEGINWWATSGPGSTSRFPVPNPAGRLINSLPGIPAQYEDYRRNEKAAEATALKNAVKEAKAADEAAEKEAQRQRKLDHSWYKYDSIHDGASWFHDPYYAGKQVAETRPPSDSYTIWLPRAEHLRAKEIGQTITADQMKDICQVAA